MSLPPLQGLPSHAFRLWTWTFLILCAAESRGEVYKWSCHTGEYQEALAEPSYFGEGIPLVSEETE